MKNYFSVALFTVACQLASGQTPNGNEHWVSTWASAQQQPRPPAAPAGAQAPPATAFNNQTVRMIAHTSLGGRRVRVQLSNAYGTAPLAIGAAHVALRSKDSAIVDGSDRALLFNGKPAVKIPPGALMVSDPVDLNVPQLSDLAVSVYVPGDAGTLTTHSVGLHTTYVSAPGDFTSQTAIAEPAATTQSWYWLADIDVLAPADAGAIVTFGDSITDGVNSTRETDHSWPALLAQRLLANPATAKLAVVNEGISGNRILTDGAGTNALARFERDVLSIPGAKWVTILEGINDIGQGFRTKTVVTADELIGGMRQMIERAHTQGIKVIGCTMTPYEGAGYYSEDGEVTRQAVNAWIRTGGAFDAVVDFDAVTRDPEHVKQFPVAFNNTDHLHPNDAGYTAMAAAFDLSIFTKR